MPKISKVLILGCSGLVGHGISIYLLKKNFIIIGTSSKKKIRSLNKNLKIYNNINLLNQSSFTKINKIVKVNKIQAIINCAALVPNKQKQKEKDFYTKSLIINSLCYNEIYKICEQNKIKFLINISTPNVQKINRENLWNYHNFYIFTKFLAEQYLSNLSNKKMNIVSLRIKSPYGYILNTKAVIPNFINTINKNKKIILQGNLTLKRSFTFVEDIGAACEKIFINKLNGIKYCLGTDQINIKNLSVLIKNICSNKKNFFKNDYINLFNSYKFKDNMNPEKTPIIVGLHKILNFNKKVKIFK